jgi:hypothetical protein
MVKQMKRLLSSPLFLSLLLACLMFSCGVKKPPVPLYTLPSQGKYLTAEDASMAPRNTLYPLLSPTPTPSFKELSSPDSTDR